MSGGLFLLPYTPSWQGKRQLYLYIKNCSPLLPSAFLLLSVPLTSTVHVYKGVLKGQRKSWPIVYFLFRGSTYSSLRFRDHTQTQVTRYDSYGRVIGPSQRLLPDSSQDSQQTVVHVLREIRTRNPRKREAADSSLRSRGHWDRLTK